MRKTLLALLVTLLLTPGSAPAQVDHLELKWMRDSEEYQRLVEQIYRGALAAVDVARRDVPSSTPWAVVLDVDETVLDNSVYQLDRATYGIPYDTASWNAWVRLEQAPPLPGVTRFLDAVRAAGGRIAFITNRHEWVREETRRNLDALGLWGAADRLCLRTTDAAYTKRVRRTEARAGQGACAWEGEPVRIVAYIGDQMGDMPEPDEGVEREFGINLFLIPNPSYGDWERAVTRQ